MKRRIAKYLKSKEESQYSKLDYILSLYLSGSLAQIINKYDFLKIEIFTEKLYNGFGLQVRFCYFNLTVIIDFFDLDFEFIIYEQDEPIESIEENTTIFNIKTTLIS